MSADLYVANAGGSSTQYNKLKAKQLRKAASKDGVGEHYATVTADQYMHKTSAAWSRGHHQSEVQISRKSTAKANVTIKDSAAGSDAVFVQHNGTPGLDGTNATNASSCDHPLSN